MKKLFIAAFLLANIAILSSCERDHCPAHGQVPAVENGKNV